MSAQFDQHFDTRFSVHRGKGILYPSGCGLGLKITLPELRNNKIALNV